MYSQTPSPFFCCNMHLQYHYSLSPSLPTTTITSTTFTSLQTLSFCLLSNPPSLPSLPSHRSHSVDSVSPIATSVFPSLFLSGQRNWTLDWTLLNSAAVCHHFPLSLSLSSFGLPKDIKVRERAISFRPVPLSIALSFFPFPLQCPVSLTLSLLTVLLEAWSVRFQYIENSFVRAYDSLRAYGERERERERERESCVCVQLGRVLVEEKIRDCPKRISKTTIIVSLSLSLTHTHTPSLSHSLTLSLSPF
jgi:hypothetical protein